MCPPATMRPFGTGETPVPHQSEFELTDFLCMELPQSDLQKQRVKRCQHDQHRQHRP